MTWAGAGLVFAATGCIGLAAAVWPDAWMAMFTQDPAIRETGSAYLRVVGGCYGFFGLGLALFFASQGAGRLMWALVASSTRLAVVIIGGWLYVRWTGASMGALFGVIALSFAALGVTLAVATHLSDWRR